MNLPVDINEATARLLLSYCLRNNMTTSQAIAKFAEDGLNADEAQSILPRTKFATKSTQLCIKTIYKIAASIAPEETFRFEDLLSAHQLEHLTPARLSSWRYNFHRWVQGRLREGTMQIRYFTGFVEPVYNNRAEPLAPIP